MKVRIFYKTKRLFLFISWYCRWGFSYFHSISWPD